MLGLQRAHLIKKKKKNLGISYLSHCLRAFAQNWQTSHSYSCFLQSKTGFYAHPFHPLFFEMGMLNSLSFVMQVSIYTPYDYICYSVSKMGCVKLHCTELYPCKLCLLSKARELDNGLVIDHGRKKIFSWNNRHFMANCWKDVAPKKLG